MRSSKAYRHFIRFLQKGIQDEYGESWGHKEVFSARCDVLERSGSQMESFGTVVTSEVITVDMFADDRLDKSMFIDWQGCIYSVNHIKKSRDGRKFIVTCEIVT